MKGGENMRRVMLTVLVVAIMVAAALPAIALAAPGGQGGPPCPTPPCK